MAVTEDLRGGEQMNQRGNVRPRSVFPESSPRASHQAAPGAMPASIWYDAIADTIHFRHGDRSRPVVVTICADELCTVVDRETRVWVGFQIENYLFAIKDMPEFASLLDDADILGMARADAISQRNHTLGWRGRARAYWADIRFELAFLGQRLTHHSTGTSKTVARMQRLAPG